MQLNKETKPSSLANSNPFFLFLISLYIYIFSFLFSWGCPRGVMVKAMDCRIVESEFVLQLCYYVHFWANTVGKGMNPLILLAMC